MFIGRYSRYWRSVGDCRVARLLMKVSNSYTYFYNQVVADGDMAGQALVARP